MLESKMTWDELFPRVTFDTAPRSMRINFTFMSISLLASPQDHRWHSPHSQCRFLRSPAPVNGLPGAQRGRRLGCHPQVDIQSTEGVCRPLEFREFGILTRRRRVSHQPVTAQDYVPTTAYLSRCRALESWKTMSEVGVSPDFEGPSAGSCEANRLCIRRLIRGNGVRVRFDAE